MFFKIKQGILIASLTNKALAMTVHTYIHLLEPWLLPPGNVILTAFIGFGIYWHSRKTGYLLILISILMLWLASAPIVAYNLIDNLQNQYGILKLTALNPQDLNTAIVVLGGGDAIRVEQNHKHTVSNATFNRIRYAAELQKKMNTPIIVSGGSDGSKDTEADLMANTLHDDFNITNVIKENKSKNTAEEGKLLSGLIKNYKFKKIILVTNAWHMPRSVYIFKRAGINVIPAPMGYEVYDHQYTALSFFPDIHALNTTCIVMHEWIGLLWYYFYY